jgi:SARP family transcriptional regulator, regulator of embCAB operon
VERRHCRNLDVTLETRIQLCGRLVAALGGRRIERELPGRQGRLLFGYLVKHRRRTSSRDELIEALWPDEPPRAVDSALSALISKLRRTVGPDSVEGRSGLRVVLPADAWIDVEAATSAIHRAESAVAREDWTEGWVAARVAQHIAVRPFMAGEDSDWIDEQRRELEGTYLRALELAAQASLRIGGGELDTAERAARELVRRSPFHESGYRCLMTTLAARGNTAEALNVYQELRVLLREALGAVPSTTTQLLHRELLG